MTTKRKQDKSNSLSTAQAVLNCLQDYGLKQESEGVYRSNSPLRPGSNSNGFKLTITDPEHGTWFDHVTDDSGSLYELAERLGIRRAQVETTKRGYDGIEDYARAHGIPASALITAGWQAETVTHQSRPALTFTTVNGNRWRFIDGKKGEKPYTSPKGYQAGWYGLNQANGLAKKTGQALVICNGEASTVAAQHNGVAACALTGGEKGAIPTQLLAELKDKWQGEIIVALDCDKPGRTKGSQLAQQLSGAGFDARAVELGLSDGGDLADFCKLHTDQAAKRLPRLADLLPPAHKNDGRTAKAAPQTGNLALDADPQPAAIVIEDARMLYANSWPYAVIEGRLTFYKRNKEGEFKPATIADYQASITHAITQETGEVTYRIGGENLRGRKFDFEIGAVEFADPRKLKGALEAASGPQCPTMPRMGEHLPTALKKLTADSVVDIRHFNRTGWDGDRFLIPGRKLPNIEISLPRKTPYGFTDDAELTTGLSALRALIDSFPATITMPIIAALLQAPLNRRVGWDNERYALAVLGRTGTFKTSFMQPAMSLYGPGFMDDANLIKWGEGATRNAIMAYAARAHDLPLLIDNFKANTGDGGRGLVNLLHNILEGGEKDRLNRAAQLRESKPVHCMPMLTAEDLPDNETATLARLLIVQFDWQRGEVNANLTEAQNGARHLNAVGRSWIDWLESDDSNDVLSDAPRRFLRARDDYAATLRATQPDMQNILRVATNLATNTVTGWVAEQHPQIGRFFKHYAAQHLRGLQAIAKTMGSATTESLAAHKYLGAIRELTSSKRMLILSDLSDDPAGQDINRFAGYSDGAGGLYLLPDITRRMVEDLLGKDALGFISKRTLYKQLSELEVIGNSVGDGRLTVKRTGIDNKTHRYLHITAKGMANHAE